MAKRSIKKSQVRPKKKVLKKKKKIIKKSFNYVFDKKFLVNIPWIKKKKLDFNFLNLTNTSIIILIGILLGMFPFLFYKGDHRIKDKDISYQCKYTEWKISRSNYCIVSPDGRLYEGDLTKYEANNERCIKYIRNKECK